MPLNNNAKNLMLDALGDAVAYVSLHSGDPGANGVNEISGGSPAYARKAIAWATAVAANLDSSNAPVFDIPPMTTVSHFAMWSAATGGTCYGGDPLSAAETFTGQGTYTLTDADINLTDPA